MQIAGDNAVQSFWNQKNKVHTALFFEEKTHTFGELVDKYANLGGGAHESWTVWTYGWVLYGTDSDGVRLRGFYDVLLRYLIVVQVTQTWTEENPLRHDPVRFAVELYVRLAAWLGRGRIRLRMRPARRARQALIAGLRARHALGPAGELRDLIGVCHMRREEWRRRPWRVVYRPARVSDGFLLGQTYHETDVLAALQLLRGVAAFMR